MLPQVEVFTQVGSLPLHRRERRPVTFTALANRADGSVAELTIVDLSVEGCGVMCTANLIAGERLSLSVTGQGNVAALVRWADRQRAGLSFETADLLESGSKTPRRHERVSVAGEVMLRRSGKVSFRVHIYDLSPDGCKAEFVERPELDEQLWIKFEGLEALEARVRWIAGANVGLRFARGLHPAVFDLIVSRLATKPQASAA